MLTEQEKIQVIKILSIWVPETERRRFIDFLHHNLNQFTEKKIDRIIRAIKMIVDVLDAHVTSSEDSDKLELAKNILENNNE